MTTQTAVSISYKNGRWSATRDRWVLASEGAGFTRLETLLSELAAAGIRACSISWEGLPAADEFSNSLYSQAARKFADGLNATFAREVVVKGFWLVALAYLEGGRMHYGFRVLVEESAQVLDELQASGFFCASVYVPPAAEVSGFRSYIEEQAKRAASPLRRQLKERGHG